MSGAGLHVANDDEARQVWPAVDSARLFDSRSQFERFRAEAPWRVQVTGRGEAVVLERWRAHLDVLSIKGVWCSRPRTPELMRSAGRIARQQGFGRILSPLVSADAVAEYEEAGMIRHGSIVALQRDRHTAPRPHGDAPDGVTIRPARSEDLSSVLGIDTACFDDFWRYDAERLSRYLAEDRAMIAQEAGRVIGYTLSTLMRASGIVGRLAVSPDAHRKGVGSALLAEAIRYLERAGADCVTLCTQEENLASRGLYRRMGFVESSGTLVFLIGSPGSPAAPGRPE